MKIIPMRDWQTETLHCLLCGSTLDVKYVVNLKINGRHGAGCVCSRCVYEVREKEEENGTGTM